MKKLVGFVFVLFLLGCASSKTSESSEASILPELLENKSFEIISDWAMPQLTNSVAQISNSGLLPPGSNAGMINLIGNQNSLQMKGDNFTAYLPYYGERQMGGGYNRSGGAIQFNGTPENFTVEEHKNGSYLIRFNIDDSNTPTENYRVRIELFPSLSTTITINSAQRFVIRYKGKVAPIQETNEKV